MSYTSEKVIKALKVLDIKNYSYCGDAPKDEATFLKGFSIHTGTETLEDGLVVAKTSNNPDDFGFTWAELKTEMDKL